ncbi:hypothetical protein [Anaerofustis butyriciformans]|uniref:hypothetical protein n=1 Tax=Anaerofustis butyriciformans TaxID=3108533 RepID=UPI002E2FBA79|nr:hypothetical protein [Anaerofustis sp. HA2171]
MKKFILCLFLSMLLMLTGCGGGSGSSYDDSSTYDNSTTYEDPSTGETYTEDEMIDFYNGMEEGYESGEWDSENGFYQP